MRYTINITAEIIDPSDTDYIATNNAVIKVSEQFGCQRSMEHNGDLEIGIFTFVTLEDVRAFRNHPTHRAAMQKVDKFYKSMKVKRSWR